MRVEPTLTKLLLSDRRSSFKELLELLESESWQDPAWRQKLEEFLRDKEQSYTHLIRSLTHLDYSEAEAQRHWEAIKAHQEDLSSRLGREMNYRVAALDYFLDIDRQLRNPTIVEMSSFLATEKNALTDGLTGLFNRKYFDSSLRRETKRARRYGLTFSVVMMDIDDFKAVNDSCGHLVGDDVLGAISAIIQESVREIDVPCRYGGEEFALILPETSRSGAFIVSERVRIDVENLAEHPRFRDRGLNLTLSGGLAIYPVDSPSEEGLVSMADRALYRSKSEGKNQITLHAAEKRRSPRLDWEKSLLVRERAGTRRDMLPSRSKNLSRNGALLESRVPVRVGAELDLCLQIDSSHQEQQLKGKVVRLQESQQGRTTLYELGIMFLVESEEEDRRIEGITEELLRPLTRPEEAL